MGRKITDKDVRTYVAKATTEAERGAEYMDWLAKECPGRVVAMPLIMKVAFNLSTIPRDGTDQVGAFKKSTWHTIRRLLLTKYKRDAKYVYGTGAYRASIDENDLLDNFIHPTRIGGAIDAVDERLALIDRSKLTPLNKVRYDTMVKSLKILRPLSDRLLPAGPKDEDKKKEDKKEDKK
jgi:hypothetical protein